MSEMPNMQVQAEHERLVALDLAGFSAEEARRLLVTRARVEQGTLNEWTADFNRLRFARWLFEHGHLQS